MPALRSILPGCRRRAARASATRGVRRVRDRRRRGGNPSRLRPPSTTASSINASNASLVTAWTRRGTRPLSPSAHFFRQHAGPAERAGVDRVGGAVERFRDQFDAKYSSSNAPRAALLTKHLVDDIVAARCALVAQSLHLHANRAFRAAHLVASCSGTAFPKRTSKVPATRRRPASSDCSH